jgi:hypothetical protein
MKAPGTILQITATAVLALLAGCDRPQATAPVADDPPALEAKKEGAAKKLSIAVCAPGAGGFTLQSTNPFFPMDVGRQSILAGESDG